MVDDIRSKEISFCPAGEEYYNLVRDISRENMLPEIMKYFGVWDEEMFKKNFLLERTVLIKNKDNFLGFFSWSKKNKKEAYLNNIQIKKEYQGQGIGRKALGFFEEIARKEGVEFIELRVFSDSKARLFYRQNAYIEKDKADANGVQIVMKKII